MDAPGDRAFAGLFRFLNNHSDDTSRKMYLDAGGNVLLYA